MCIKERYDLLYLYSELANNWISFIFLLNVNLGFINKILRNSL